MIRRDRLDKIFSDLVRERAGWRCEYSGTGPDSHLECAHIYGRRKKSVRWHPLNAVCLSHAMHRYFTENPMAFANWLRSRMDPDTVHALAKLANTPRKFTPRQIEGLYHHYLAEFARLEQARSAGRGGRIEFMFPDPIPEAEPRKRKRAKKVSKFKRKVNGSVVLRGAKVDGKRDERAA